MDYRVWMPGVSEERVMLNELLGCKVGQDKRYVSLSNNTVFPAPDQGDLGWNLIHNPQAVTRNDMLVLQSILHAYSVLIHAPQVKRNKICAALRDARGDQIQH